jgi:hypothetical protein
MNRRCNLDVQVLKGLHHGRNPRTEYWKLPILLWLRAIRHGGRRIHNEHDIERAELTLVGCAVVIAVRHEPLGDFVRIIQTVLIAVRDGIVGLSPRTDNQNSDHEQQQRLKQNSPVQTHDSGPRRDNLDYAILYWGSLMASRLLNDPEHLMAA